VRIVVTGGAGFIGSNFVRRMLRTYDEVEIVNLDKLTYAGNLENLRDVEDDPRYRFVHGDICDAGVVRAALAGADAVVNFAAETHVDRSISRQEFINRYQGLASFWRGSGASLASSMSPLTRSTAASRRAASMSPARWILPARTPPRRPAAS
jgi:nucleoside-diphosphate-sugar epimerase